MTPLSDAGCCRAAGRTPIVFLAKQDDGLSGTQQGENHAECTPYRSGGGGDHRGRTRFGPEIQGHAPDRLLRPDPGRRSGLRPQGRDGADRPGGVRHADRLQRTNQEVRAPARQVLEDGRSDHLRVRPARRREVPRRIRLRRRRRRLHAELPRRPQGQVPDQVAVPVDQAGNEGRPLHRAGHHQGAARGRAGALRGQHPDLPVGRSRRAEEQGGVREEADRDRPVQGRRLQPQRRRPDGTQPRLPPRLPVQAGRRDRETSTFCPSPTFRTRSPRSSPAGWT